MALPRRYQRLHPYLETRKSSLLTVVITLSSHWVMPTGDANFEGSIKDDQIAVGGSKHGVDTDPLATSASADYPRTFTVTSPVCSQKSDSVGPITCGAGLCKANQEWSSINTYTVDSNNTPERLSSIDFKCININDQTASIRAQMTSEFRRVQPAINAPKTQPKNSAIVNFDEIYYSDLQTQDIPLTVLGEPVVLRVIPTRFEWNFGDGANLVTSDPGKPHPHQTVTHKYRKSGNAMVSVAVTYSGQYSVSGGAFQLIDGAVSRTSPSTSIHIFEARAELVDPETR